MIPKCKICWSSISFLFGDHRGVFFSDKKSRFPSSSFLKNVHFFPKGEVDDFVVLPLGLGEDEICEIHSLDAWRTVSSQSTNQFSFLHHKKRIVPFEDPMSTKVGEIFLDIISIEEDFESNLDEELPICQNWMTAEVNLGYISSLG